MWSQVKYCDIALRDYIGAEGRIICCPLRFREDKNGGYWHYQGRPYLTGMYFACYTWGGANPKAVRVPLWDSREVFLAENGLWGAALGGCNAAGAVGGYGTGVHSSDRWGWCGQWTPHLSTLHDMNGLRSQSVPCDQNMVSNYVMYDGSAQGIKGYAQPPQ